jgi:hypothetical protein
MDFELYHKTEAQQKPDSMNFETFFEFRLQNHCPKLKRSEERPGIVILKFNACFESNLFKATLNPGSKYISGFKQSKVISSFIETNGLEQDFGLEKLNSCNVAWSQELC